MSDTTREVYVLVDFTDKQGNNHSRGDTFTAAYESQRQRAEVNQMVYRGLLTFEVDQAKAHERRTQEGSRRRRGSASSEQ